MHTRYYSISSTMLAGLSHILVVCIIKNILVDSRQCINSLIVQTDVFMDRRTFQRFEESSVYRCAATCIMSSICMSFNFHLETRTCDLNSDASTDVDTISRLGVIFSNIEKWPKSLAGPCSTVTCPSKSACVVNRKGVASCLQEFQGCGTPPLPLGSTVTYRGHFLHAVAKYSCIEDFKICLDKASTTCGSNGQWDNIDGLCGRYRWTNPATQAEYKIPCGPLGEVMIFLSGTPTNETFDFMIDVKRGVDILLHMRYSTRKIDLNSMIDGKWGKGQSLTPLFVYSQRFGMSITLKNGEYTVVADGKELVTVTEPVLGAIPLYLAVFGDIAIEMLIVNPPE